MTSDAAQILSHIPNSAIVQLPGRRFPGIVMAFAVENAPGGRLFAFTHPGTGLIGTVEERDCAGTWSDVLLPEPNDEFVLASNAHSHFHFFFLPGDRKVHKPRATERELVQAALDARSPDVISQPMPAERFVAICEKAYARHMDRLLLEGLADCDLRRLLKERNSEHAEDLSDEEFIWLKEGLREATENLLRAACAVEWMLAASLPASAWQQARGRLLVIHDRTALRLLRRRRISEAFLTHTMKRLLGASALQRNATSHICPPERLFARTPPLQETGRTRTAAAGGHLPGAVGRAVHLKVSQRRKVDNFAPAEMS